MNCRPSRARAFFTFAIFLPLLLLGLVACRGGKQTINGQVVALDPAARTFSVQATDGKKYDFTFPAEGTEIDVTHLKEHMDEKKSVKVEFTGDNPPYMASYAH
jgi:hypothetical protein